MRIRTPAPLLLLLTLVLPRAGVGQDVLTRTPNLSASWIGVPWVMHVDLPHRFRDVQPGKGLDLEQVTTFTTTLGLPFRSLVGTSFAPGSPTVPGEQDELEVFARHRLLSSRSAFADLGLTAAYNAAATSFDAEASLARWFGPLRLIAAGRWFSDARETGKDRLAFTGGLVLHPLSRTLPVAVAADVAAPTDLADEERVAWSAGLHVGLPETALTFALQASNTATTTLQGSTFSTGPTRWGFELTVPVPTIATLLGAYPSRASAVEGVVEDVEAPADVTVDIVRFSFESKRVVVTPGAVIEWVNGDEVLHTATAVDAAWGSGAIPPGGSWRARFDTPGIYTYYCGPHPFMRGVVIVR